MKGLAATTLLLAALATPVLAAAAQLRADLATVAPVTVEPLQRCTTRRAAHQAGWDVLRGAAALENDSARVVLRALADSVGRVSAERPSDVDVQYLLAGVLGARAEVEEGRDQIAAAKAVHAQVAVVLDLEAGHAGAQHMLGRLHHEVLRMSRVKRFLALRLLGGSELGGASWEEAQRLLEAGVVDDRCSIERHYDLARLQLDRGDAAGARQRLEHVLAIRPASARDSLLATKARALLERLDRFDGSGVGS